MVVHIALYFGSLKAKLEEENPGSSEKLVALQKPLQEILKNFKDLQFFSGESMNADAMIVLGDYKVWVFKHVHFIYSQNICEQK